MFTKKLVALAMLITRSRTAAPGATRITSGSESGRRLARNASYWTSVRSAPFVAIPPLPFVAPPDIFMPPADFFPGARRAARMSAGSRVVKSLSITTTSCSSGAGWGSRMMSGAVIIGCSCRPKCECIQ